MAKIAADLERAVEDRRRQGASGGTTARRLATGSGWVVDDVLCTAGPHDLPFEERHAEFGVALVVAGSFQYRSAAGAELMTPGSLMLASLGQSFECRHDQGAGDRCLSFRFEPAYFERVAADAGRRHTRLGFERLRLPPLRALSPLVARACAGMAGAPDVAWEDLALLIAGQALELDRDRGPARGDVPQAAIARVTRAVRAVERQPESEWPLADLAREARLSPFHFLRTFLRVTGLTPHQYVLRTRLRAVAARLSLEPRRRVLDVALDAGFGDVSNFNRAFKAEFGLSPRAVRSGMSARAD